VIYSNISNAARLKLFHIIEDCCAVKTEEDFKAIFEKIKGLLGQEMAAYGIGVIHTKKVISNLNVGFPVEFMMAIVDASDQMESPLFKKWLERKTPQVLEFSNKKNLPAFNNLNTYLDFSMQNVISHGVLDFNQQYATYFGIAKIPERIGTYHTRTMDILAPALHTAYSELLKVKKPVLISLDDSSKVKPRTTLKRLSAREHEVLCWLFDGKSNGAIGEMLHISENTVKNHTKRIYTKLRAGNRQEAVMIALKADLIELQ